MSTPVKRGGISVGSYKYMHARLPAGRLMDELRRLTQKERSLVEEHQRVVQEFKSTLRQLQELRKQLPN